MPRYHQQANEKEVQLPAGVSEAARNGRPIGRALGFVRRAGRGLRAAPLSHHRLETSTDRPRVQKKKSRASRDYTLDEQHPFLKMRAAICVRRRVDRSSVSHPHSADERMSLFSARPQLLAGSPQHFPPHRLPRCRSLCTIPGHPRGLYTDDC